MRNLHSFQALTAVFLWCCYDPLPSTFCFSMGFHLTIDDSGFFSSFKMILDFNSSKWICHYFRLLLFYGKGKTMHLTYVLTDEVCHIGRKNPFLTHLTVQIVSK